MRNVPKLSTNALPLIKERLANKARQSSSKFKISAMAFDERGNFIGGSFNGLPKSRMALHKGSGIHAEAKLLKKYGSVVKTIVLARVGNGGAWRPIKPCKHCMSLAKKMGVNVITIRECREDLFC